MSDKIADELTEVINRRIKLARLDAQVDLITEMGKRPGDIDEWEWARLKLAELKKQIDEL